MEREWSSSKYEDSEKVNFYYLKMVKYTCGSFKNTKIDNAVKAEVPPSLKYKQYTHSKLSFSLKLYYTQP